MILTSALSLSLSLAGAMENTNHVFPTAVGSSGTLRTFSSRPNTPDYFSVSLMGSFFSTEPFIDAQKHSRSFLRLNGNYTFDWAIPVEFFVGSGFTFNENSNASNSTTLTTLLENTDLGVRLGFGGEDSIFYFGTSGFLRFFSGSNALRNASGGSTTRSGPFLSGMAGVGSTLDLSKKNEDFPLRWHMNVNYRAPNSNLVGTTQDFNKFALDAFRYQAVVASTSMELAYRKVIPFIEVWGEYAFGTSAVKFKENRKKATLGLRWSPITPVGILLAGDIGLGGIGSGQNDGVPRNPPWEFWGGVHFAVDGQTLKDNHGSIRGAVMDDETGLPLEGVSATIASETQRPQLTDLSGYYEFGRVLNGDYDVNFMKEGYEPQNRRATIREGQDLLLDVRLRKIGPKMGNLVAQVLDPENQQPLARAIVSISGVDNALATDSDGRFRVNKLQEGPHSLRIEAPGYRPGDFSVDIKGNETVDQKFTLEKLPPETGDCRGVVKNAEGTPLTATFTPEEGVSAQAFVTDPITGEFSTTLPPGKYKFKVQAENYLPSTVDCDVTPGQKTELGQITMEKPKEAVVVENKIILPDAIYFEFGSAKIREDSFGILDQVSGILTESKDFKGLQVEGHTDYIGSDESNQKLSENRAKSVRTYLIKKGVPAKKIKALGFGESKPIATNSTPQGRAENRRVEFNIQGGQE